MSLVDIERRMAELEAQLLESQMVSRQLQSGLTTEGDLNNFFVLVSASMVFFMQSGFALLEVGTVARKNTKNILVKNVFDAAIGALCWWVFGFAFAFGNGDSFANNGKNGFAGTEGFFFDFNGANTKKFYHLEAKAIWFFQWAFAGTATTIVSGAVAERCSFTAYLTYAIILTSFIYPFVAHMTWSADGKFSPFRDNRLFGGCGLIDFGGSATVHMTGGIASIIAAYFVGPRTGRFEPDWVPPEPHPVYQTLGVLILWLGWYSFNGGSMLVIVGYSGVVSHVMMTTTIAAAAGCICTTLIGYLHTHIIDPACVNNGILAGLVSVTSACATASPVGALIIGLGGGPVFYCADKAMVHILKIDDVVSAFPVHGACGMWGVIAAALFSTPYYYGFAYSSARKYRCAGVFYGGNPAGSFKAAITAILVIIAWTGSTMTITFFTLRKLNKHRVSSDVERDGMDASKHGGALMSSKYYETSNENFRKSNTNLPINSNKTYPETEPKKETELPPTEKATLDVPPPSP